MKLSKKMVDMGLKIGGAALGLGGLFLATCVRAKDEDAEIPAAEGTEIEVPFEEVEKTEEVEEE